MRRSPRHLRPLLAAGLAVAGLCGPAAPAGATEVAPGEIVVKREGEPPRVVRGVDDVRATVRRLRRDGDVAYAAPNPIARASAVVPNDPGFGRGWQAVQWNFSGPVSVNAPDAWQHAHDAGSPGARGVRIAVLDSGVAYSDRGRFARSPDLGQTTFAAGFDFVGRDAFPHDENGHGTHVASTIAESTNNGVGLTGLAYNATIVPVRVLDRNGEGDAARIAEAVRWAVRRNVSVINLSLEFGTDVGARDIPSLLDALAFARRKGVLVVGAAGNEGHRVLAFPARSSNVFSVGATTEHGCLSDFSNLGRELDIVAPGGGADTALEDANCKPDGTAGRPIHQITFTGRTFRRFGVPNSYEGTSMAAPHVSATAALVIASRVFTARPTPEQLIARLKGTSRDLGPKGLDSRYGAGLVDAGAATNRARLIVPSRAEVRFAR